MVQKDSKNNLFLLTIVGIVAIVAIIIMIASSGSRTNTLSESTSYYDSSAEVAGGATRATVESELINEGRVSSEKNPAPAIKLYCTDSDDGKDYDTKGTVNYADRTKESSKTDYCRKYDSSTLVEYYCKKNKIASTDYTCKYGCSDGACVNIDSLTYWTEWFNRDGPSGEADFEHKMYFTSVCANPIAVECQRTDGTDYIVSGQDVFCNRDVGAICYNALNPEGCYDYEVRFLCPNNYVPSEAKVKCSETDSGRDIYTKGFTTGTTYKGDRSQPQKLMDHCQTPTDTNLLVEYSCGSDEYLHEELAIQCPNGCFDGACIKPVDNKLGVYPEFLFEDMNDLNSFKGQIVLGQTAPASDVLVAVDIAASLFKINGTGNITSIAAGIAVLDDDASYTKPSIIINGPCVNTLSAWHLNNPIDCSNGYESGVGRLDFLQKEGQTAIMVSGYTEQDIKNARTVLVNWADYEQDIGSAASVCIEGPSSAISVYKCDPLPKGEEVTCIDSDGIDYYIKGQVVIDPYFDGSRFVLEDACGSQRYEGYVIEYTCNLNDNGDTYVPINYLCPNGCRDGACIQPEIDITEQVISLTTGWNYFSLNVKPDSLMIEDLMKELVEEGSLELVKDNMGVVYWPDQGIYNLKQIRLEEGYLINVRQNTQLIVRGQKIPLPFVVPLNNGWNLMSYPAQNPAVAMDVVAELRESGVLVKVQDEAGNAIENLPGIGWIDNIKQFSPGKGYMINVNQEAKLVVKEYPYCGNQVIEGIEQCDGYNIGAATCQDFGYIGGILTCNSMCELNLQECITDYDNYSKYLILEDIENYIFNPNSLYSGGESNPPYYFYYYQAGYEESNTNRHANAIVALFSSREDALGFLSMILSDNGVWQLKNINNRNVYYMGQSNDQIFVWVEGSTLVGVEQRAYSRQKIATSSSSINSLITGNVVASNDVTTPEMPVEYPAYYASPVVYSYLNKYPSDLSVSVDPICGNGVQDIGEQCDGNVWAHGATCEYFGYSGGTLSCTTECTFDFSQCVSVYSADLAVKEIIITSDGTADFDGRLQTNVNAIIENIGSATSSTFDVVLAIDDVAQSTGNGYRALAPGETVGPFNVGGGSYYTVGTHTALFIVKPHGPDAISNNNVLKKEFNVGTGFCGDGIVSGYEQCDGSDSIGLKCTDINGFTGGELSCYPPGSQNECSWNIAKCIEFHVNANMQGDYIVHPGDTVTITWTASSNMYNYLRYIDAIYLESESRLTIEHELNILGTSGTYLWTVPSYFPAGEYAIELGIQPQGYGPFVRSNQFTITTDNNPVSRSFSVDPASINSDVTVTLTKTLQPGQSTLLVEENVPDGFTIVSPGTGSVNSKIIRWAEIVGATSGKYAYTVRTPNVAGTGIFSGVYSINGGETISIAGDNSLAVRNEEYCGDNIINNFPYEECDGSTAGLNCVDIDPAYSGGQLTCNSNCQFDTSLCYVVIDDPVCGDGVVNGYEQCDGEVIPNGLDCTAFNGFVGGILSCDSECQFDVTNCDHGYGYCGDDVINNYPNEQCEGNAYENGWGSIYSCTDFGFTAGTLNCNNCQFDTSACNSPAGQGVCGDQILNSGEQCEMNRPFTVSCEDFDSFEGGDLTCDYSTCTYDISGCIAPTSTVCTDTDGGLNYYITGVSTGNYAGSSQPVICGLNGSPWCFARTDGLPYSTYYDHCWNSSISNQLNEGFCMPDGRMGAMGINCPNGCFEGRCLDPYENVCTDTDGLNESIKGTVTGMLNGAAYTYHDECTDIDYVEEHYCDGNQHQSMETECQSRCINGACIDNTNDMVLLLSNGETKTITQNGIDYVINFVSYEYGENSIDGRDAVFLSINGQSLRLRQEEYLERYGLRIFLNDLFITNIGGDGATIQFSIISNECNVYNNNCNGPICGDGVLTEFETCDAQLSLPLSCDEGYSGNVYCDNSCSIVYDCNPVIPYTPVCGDNYRDGTEQCDEDDLGYQNVLDVILSHDVSQSITFNGKTYTISYLGGNSDDETIILRVNSDTRTMSIRDTRTIGGLIVSFVKYDEISPKIQIKSNMNTCEDLGFAEGTLSCYEPDHVNACTYDTTDCFSDIPIISIGSYPIPFVEEERANGKFVIGVYSSPEDSSAMLILSQDIKINNFATLPFEYDIDTIMPATENMIVVGGACANRIAENLLGNPYDCTVGLQPGQSRIKLFKTGSDTYALLVYGYTASDTANAAYVLTHRQDFSDVLFGATQVCISGSAGNLNVMKC